MAQQNQAHLNLRDHNLQCTILCFYSPRQKPLVCERLILKSKLFEWMNWTTSRPELIPWFLSSVELSSKHADREWNCHVVLSNNQLLANRVVDAHILLLRGYGACSVMQWRYCHSRLRAPVLFGVLPVNILINGRLCSLNVQHRCLWTTQKCVSWLWHSLNLLLKVVI